MLADGDGILVLANRRMEEIFGYEQDDLAGHPVESLIPADLHLAHHSHRADCAQAPGARPVGAGARLVGLRKDGTTFPVEISLSPIPTTTGQLTLAVIRYVNQTRRRHDLLDMARAAVAAGPRPPVALTSSGDAVGAWVCRRPSAGPRWRRAAPGVAGAGTGRLGGGWSRGCARPRR